MNANENKLDQIFKKKLGQYEVSAPQSAWQHVQKNALNKKSRRFPWMWIGIAAVILSVLAALFFMAENSQSGKTDSPEKSAVIEQKKERQTASESSTTTSILKDGPADELRRAGGSQSTEEKSAVPSQSAEASSAETVQSSVVPPETPSSPVENNSSKSKTQASSTTGHNTTTDNTSNAANESFKEEEAGSGQLNPDRSNSAREEDFRAPDQSKDPSDATREAAGNDSEVDIHSKSKTRVQERNKLSVVSELPPAENAFDAFERRILTEGESSRVGPCQVGLSKKEGCFGFKNKSPVRFALSAYYGPEFPLRSLTTTNPELNDFADLRNQTESYMYSQGMGIRATAKWFSGLKIGTGLHLSKWQEKFDYTDEDAEIVNIIEVVVDTITATPTDTTILYDTLSVTEEGTKRYQNTNSYTFFDVPLILGFEVEGSRMSLSINSGVFLHLLFHTEGQVLAANEKPVRYDNRNKTDHSIFKTNIGASLYTSVGLYYKVSKHWDIQLEPSIKYMIKPVTESSYSLEQRYVSFNLYMGMRYRF